MIFWLGFGIGFLAGMVCLAGGFLFWLAWVWRDGPGAGSA